MTIAGVAGALPPHYYPQDVLLAALSGYWEDRLENPLLLKRLHWHTGVGGRYLAVPLERYYELKTWGQSNDVWIDTALDLGQKAIGCALQRAGLVPEDVGALFFVSVTGVASPSIDARLMNRMPFPRNMKRNPIFGLGCVAGAAGIARASDYVRAFPDQVAVLLSVELCSLTLQRADLSVANLISSGLFGDGAAAVVIAGAERHLDGPRILATQSTFYPGTEDVMGWDISENGFQIVLSREVPDVIRKNLGGDLDRFLAGHGLTRKDIGSWIMHTGGPKVLEATADAIGATRDELAASWESLNKVGNLSSASVLLVLEDVMTKRRPAPGTFSVLAAAGPGFCSELVLLKW
ncbi:MAG TPA: 3-oxoacyl-[acyl-carrier-protein] synthase III C-terminal domain-containing protein [Bryobacteraceae bacterium]|nr:3-oxoacyl-[acyl-carrier-protein] synthase III C-terminal domain-containing protein [Bryobacteraceae bacterium]